MKTKSIDLYKRSAHDMFSCHYYRITEHYCHAREKHPYFADELEHCGSGTDDVQPENWLESCRIAIVEGNTNAMMLLLCECAEASVEIERNNTAAAVSECYDAIAVLLRMVDVLEGRQKLGKPEEAK